MQLRACVVVGQLQLLRAGPPVPPTTFRISSLVRFRSVSWLRTSLDDFFIGGFSLWLFYLWARRARRRFGVGRSAFRTGITRRIAEITTLDLAQFLFRQVF